MLTDNQIEYGKAKVTYSLNEGGRHEHHDCIRMAYEWLDAQKKIKNPTTKTFALKHIIEEWAGRYISTSDVEVAAYLHPEIHGRYPHFNISARLTVPSDSRLSGISEALSQRYRDRFDSSVYSAREPA
ncbi:MAG: hypothetical protein AB7N69_06690 [Immundisolibacter sp.]|uniref:hypothetical protein n=1 Tax=Immundisolibacter sp. TaxID=1934948 RepID=UPI003D0AD99C